MSDKLAEALREARADLAAYIDADWPEQMRDTYPTVMAKWKRDMELCWRIDAALAAYDAAKGGAPDVQIEFLLSVAKDDEATIQRLEADLKESRDYALALEQELRDRANSQPAWGPPTAEHREGFECLAENSFGIWRHVKWTNGRWMVRGTFNEVEPTDLAPLPHTGGRS